MSIKRDDIDNRKVDFSNVASGRRLPPLHPGEILRDEFLTPMKISVYELANAIKVPVHAPMTSCLAAGQSRSIPRFASGDTSAHGRSSRSIFRRVTIWTWPTAPCGVGWSRKIHPARLDQSIGRTAVSHVESKVRRIMCAALCEPPGKTVNSQNTPVDARSAPTSYSCVLR